MNFPAQSEGARAFGVGVVILLAVLLFVLSTPSARSKWPTPTGETDLARYFYDEQTQVCFAVGRRESVWMVVDKTACKRAAAIKPRPDAGP